MKILDAMWFTPMLSPCIGIVRGEDLVTREVKYYIGMVEPMGIEKTDRILIAENGAKFPKEAGDKLFAIGSDEFEEGFRDLEARLRERREEPFTHDFEPSDKAELRNSEEKLLISICSHIWQEHTIEQQPRGNFIIKMGRPSLWSLIKNIMILLKTTKLKEKAFELE